MGQDPDAVVDGSVHARLQLIGCICLHLLELCCFKLVLADHQRAIQPFLEQGRIHLSLDICPHEGVNDAIIYAD